MKTMWCWNFEILPCVTNNYNFWCKRIEEKNIKPMQNLNLQSTDCQPNNLHVIHCVDKNGENEY